MVKVLHMLKGGGVSYSLKIEKVMKCPTLGKNLSTELDPEMYSTG